MIRKAITALAACGIIAAGFIIIEALRCFMWLCYYAGIAM